MTLGVVGLLCMMIVIVVVAKILTRPLEWMDSKAIDPPLAGISLSTR